MWHCWLTQKGWTPDAERIRAATATLIHRGPDEQGVFSSRLCSLGATRLKILDLAAGDQPITSSDGDTVIVFNGEFYNHLELRPELEAIGLRVPHRIAIPRPCFTLFWPGIRPVFPACAVCLPSPCGASRPGGSFWPVTGWGSSRST